MKIDHINSQILEILKKDARIPFTSIAEKLEISDATVHIRVKKMINGGIIKGFTIKVNPETLNNRIYGLVLINVVPGSLEEVARSLTENEKIDAIYETHGRDDLVMKIWAHNLGEMRKALLQIRSNPKVRSTELTTVLRVWKETMP